MKTENAETTAAKNEAPMELVLTSPEAKGQKRQVVKLDGEMMYPEDIIIIGRDTKDGPEHPNYDKRAHRDPTESMTKNIMTFGVLQAVGVRRNGDRVECIWGRQRIINAREANKRLVAMGLDRIRIPVTFKKAEDNALLSLLIIENEHRTEDNVIVRARKALALSDRGKSLQEIADTFGKDPSTVDGWMQLLDLHPEVIEAIEQDVIGSDAAKNLLKLDRREQVSMLHQWAEKGVPTAAEAKEQVREKKKEKNKKEGTDTENETEVEEKETGARPLGAVEIRHLLAAHRAKLLNVDPLVIETIQVMIGQKLPDRIEGLKEALRNGKECKIVKIDGEYAFVPKKQEKETEAEPAPAQEKKKSKKKAG